MNIGLYVILVLILISVILSGVIIVRNVNDDGMYTRALIRDKYGLYEKLYLGATEELVKLKKERLPAGMTNFIGYMDYRKINQKSDQWKLQLKCETDWVSGIRTYDKRYYCVALGSAYGRDLGDTWRVTLKNGSEFNIILAEFKDDGNTDYFGHSCLNYDEQDCTNVIEFIVDKKELIYQVRSAGTFTALGFFGGLYGDGGNIVKMEYTGRIWK